MIATPTLDKYPRAMQAAVDVHSMQNLRFGTHLAFYESLSEILDSCLQDNNARKEDLIILNMLFYVPPAAYDDKTLGYITDTYGEHIAATLADFAASGDIEAFMRTFDAAASFDNAMDIFEHENATSFATRNTAELERKRALADVLAESGSEKNIAALCARESRALARLIDRLDTPIVQQLWLSR